MNSNTAFETRGRVWDFLHPATPEPGLLEAHGKLAPSTTYPMGVALGYHAESGIWKPKYVILGITDGIIISGDFPLEEFEVTDLGITINGVMVTDGRIYSREQIVGFGVLANGVMVTDAPEGWEEDATGAAGTNGVMVTDIAYTEEDGFAVNGVMVTDGAIVTDIENDGVGPIRRLLKYPCVTDAQGNASLGASSRADDTKFESVPMITRGAFFSRDILGILTDEDAASLGTSNGRDVNDPLCVITLNSAG